jgi:hypothetical protein
MIKFTPVSINDHDLILGKDFNTKLASFMSDFYAPFKKYNLDIQVAKETWEYGVKAGIPNATWVGAGKNIVDVTSPMADFDVKGISIDNLNKGLTTEASFLQNIKAKNASLFSNLYANKDYAGLKSMFVDPYMDKIKPTKNLHLLAIIREKETKKVYYCLFKVEPTTISSTDFITQMEPVGTCGVSVPMIESTYGRTYLYSNKRRLEIRLNTQGLMPFLVYSHTY